MPNLAAVATYITDLTKGVGPKNRKIDWSDDCQKTFDTVKSLITSAPVLLMPDRCRSFRIECDASDYAVGTVLLQRYPKYDDVWKPVAFISKKLSDAERNYPTQERELLAILFACKNWRCFAKGSGHKVFTNHRPSQYYKSSSKVSPRFLVRWMQDFEMYQPFLVYKTGVNNVVPNALSRREGPDCDPDPVSMEPEFLYEMSTAILSKVWQPSDTSLLTGPCQDWPIFFKEKKKGWPGKWRAQLEKEEANFEVIDNVLYRLNHDATGREVLKLKFITFARRADLIEDFHRGFGHSGQLTCQLLSRNKKGVHHAPMKSLEAPASFARWHIDFIRELSTSSNENCWILMTVNYAINWPIARALKSATADEIVRFLYEEIGMKFGCPVEVASDGGANFLNKILK
ncbi:uncharacterized protein ATC70_011129 [Mucor velutinosus]|uniref:Integrase catalytic domain-containing protein n=1 Tax=Mucor velutinosus TaxID=708070 RepID=A0AAN7DG37_9FUNG|nr:hypothetical protein ATC70_011129 [Mucor velutinosus]